MPDLSSFDNIISQTIETLDDEVSGEFCTCYHLLEEHFIGKCYALEFNGIIWYACNCKKVIPYEFKVKFYVTEENIAA